MSEPHPSYLVTLAAGEFAEITDKARVGDREVPLSYLVPKGREEDARRTFQRTPEMIEHFSEITGVPYPWNKYAQIVVADFIFGGMENTTATTMYEHILLDERAAIDISSDDLGRPRARAPVVRRLRDVPRLVRGVAQRGVRDVLRARLAREKPRPRRVRLRAQGRSGRVRRRGARALPPPHRLPGLRRPARSVRPAPLREGRPRLARAPDGARRRALLARHPLLPREPRARRRRDARPSARDGGRERAQSRALLRAGCPQGRAPGDGRRSGLGEGRSHRLHEADAGDDRRRARVLRGAAAIWTSRTKRGTSSARPCA